MVHIQPVFIRVGSFLGAMAAAHLSWPVAEVVLEAVPCGLFPSALHAMMCFPLLQGSVTARYRLGLHLHYITHYLVEQLLLLGKRLSLSFICAQILTCSP